jgi:hypothetical protein
MRPEDGVARSLRGDAYDRIPKQVFAVVAFNLADCASDEGVGNGGELRRFVEELDAMLGNAILEKSQVTRARKAVLRLMQAEAGNDELRNEGAAR